MKALKSTKLLILIIMALLLISSNALNLNTVDKQSDSKRIEASDVEQEEVNTNSFPIKF